MAQQAKFIITAIDATKKAFASASKGFTGLTKQSEMLSSQLLQLAGVGGFGLFIKSSIDAADKAGKVSEKLGITTEALTGLRFAVTQTSEVTEQQFDIALQRMVRRLEDAAEKGGGVEDQLNKIGLSAKDLAQLSPDQALLKIADAFQQTNDQGLKVKTAFSLFDTEGVNLVNTLQQGSGELNRLTGEARQLGIVLDTETSEAAARLNDNLDTLAKSLKATGFAILDSSSPALLRISDAMREAAKDGGVFQALMVALGGVMLEVGDAVTGNSNAIIKLGEDAENTANKIKPLKIEITNKDELDENMVLMSQAFGDIEMNMNALADTESKINDKKAARNRIYRQQELAEQNKFFALSNSLMQGGGRSNFEAGKTLAIANALIKGKEAVTSAYAFGAKYGGPVGGAAAALIAFRATQAQINAIRSTSYGGGGGGGAPASGIGEGSPLAVPDAQPQTSTNIVVIGGGSMSDNDVLDLIGRQNQLLQDNDIQLIPPDSSNAQEIRRI